MIKKFNKKVMKTSLVFSLCALSLSAIAQKHGTGLIFNDAVYGASVKRAKMTRGTFTELAPNTSLRAYCPRVGNQDTYSTCVGWASSYAARTILWARSKGITNTQEITNHAFSPGYVYRNIVDPSDHPTCGRGALISSALDVLRDKGDVTYQRYNVMCPDQVPPSLDAEAQAFKIKEHATLFEINEVAESKIERVKKALEAKNPVVIGMYVPNSFHTVHTTLWQPTPQEKAAPLPRGGHAMCVIGYDDDKFGGAIEIMNSWGTSWGEQGFCWIKYEDFAKYVCYAHELVYLDDTPKPSPIVSYDFVGELRLTLADGSDMPVHFKDNPTRGAIVEDDPENDSTRIGKDVFYQTQNSYSEGTRFRVMVKNGVAGYVYIISTDATLKMATLFPHRTDISPFLPYTNAEIALPSERSHIKLDNVVGTDVICLLYSKKELDIKDINRRLEGQSGELLKNLYTLLKDELVPEDKVKFFKHKMGFEISSGGKGSIVPLIIKMNHVAKK